MRYFARNAGIAIAVGFLMIACGGGDDGIGLQSETRSLGEVNDSGYSGEVVLLSPGDNRTQVTVAIGQDDSATGNFPAAIQRSTCDGLSGDEVHDLGTTESGLLAAMVQASIDDLTGDDHALVLFENDDRSVYVACADL